MRASIRRLHSPDVDDLRTWKPPDPECFGVLIQMLVGPEGDIGEESFDFLVCTPKWLLAEHGRDAVIFMRHYVIVFTFDYHRLSAALEELVAQSIGSDWEAIASLLGRHGAWEFEDYVPHDPTVRAP
jgi:hypothetical protein